jgi:FkbM family methyltransferase
MLFDFIEKINSSELCVSEIRGILHVGSHDGAELDYYLHNGINDIIFCEANPDIYSRLVSRCDGFYRVKCYNYAICDRAGKINLNVTNNDSASSSILDLKDHKHYYPHIYNNYTISVPSITIDELFSKENIHSNNYNLLNIDIQGAELMAIKGMSEYIMSCDYIYSEVNFQEMYDGCCMIEDFDKYLFNLGFYRFFLADTGNGFGDALYIKNNIK